MNLVTHLYLDNVTFQPTKMKFDLKIVQTKAILFLKSMSERVGSDIQRLRNKTMHF